MHYIGHYAGDNRSLDPFVIHSVDFEQISDHDSVFVGRMGLLGHHAECGLQNIILIYAVCYVGIPNVNH